MHSPSGAPNFACRLASLLVESIESNLTMIGWIPWLIFLTMNPTPKLQMFKAEYPVCHSLQKRIDLSVLIRVLSA